MLLFLKPSIVGPLINVRKFNKDVITKLLQRECRYIDVLAQISLHTRACVSTDIYTYTGAHAQTVTA